MSAPKFEYGMQGPVGTVRTFEEIVEPYSAAATYSPGATVAFDIPCGRKNTFIDPSKTFLEFTLNNTCQVAALTTSCAQLDGSAHSVIKRLRLTDRAGGSNLEMIEEYAALRALHIAATSDTNSLSGYRSGPEGFLPARTAYTAAAAITWLSPGVTTGMYQGQVFEKTTLASQVTSTANASVSNSAPAYANASSQTFAIPLMSTIGLLGDKYIPVHKLTRDMRLELTLNDARGVFKRVSPHVSATAPVTDKNNQVFRTAIATLVPYPGAADVMTIPGYTLSDVRLHVGYVQVDDETIAMIEKQTGGVYRWASQSYQWFRNHTNFASLSNSFTIPVRVSSARSVMSVWRETAALANPIPRYTSAFPRTYTTSFQYLMGSKYLPQRPVASTSLSIRYFLDCIESYMGRVFTGKGNSISLISSSQDESMYTNPNDNGGTYCMAADLGGPCGNDLDTFMGGAQTLGSDLLLNTNHLVAPTSGSPVGFYCDSYVLYDVLFEIDNDGNFSATV